MIKAKLLTLARDLRRRKARERQQRFVAEGVRTVEELLASRLTVHGVLMAPSLHETARGAALVDAVALAGIEPAWVTEAELSSAADTDTPQGVLAIAEIPSHALGSLQTGPGSRLVVLDAVQDPGNAGTILRTAAALGASGVVALPGTVDLWNPKVVRSAMGASFHLPTVAASVPDLVVALRAAGVELWGAGMGGEVVGSVPPPSSLAIAVGNEGAGLTGELMESTDRTVSIPIAPSVESLNVAVATGILLYTLKA